LKKIPGIQNFFKIFTYLEWVQDIYTVHKNLELGSFETEFDSLWSLQHTPYITNISFWFTQEFLFLGTTFNLQIPCNRKVWWVDVHKVTSS
jgi:hypothetical protein